MWKKLAEMWRKLSTGGKALTIVVAALVVIVLLFCFLPVMKVPYDVEESYVATETYYTLETTTVEEEYTEMEPYTEIEIQCDLEPCSENVPIDYVIVGGQGVNYFAYDGSPQCLVELTITNTDVISGNFTAEFLITLSSNVTTTISATKYIEAGATRTITAYYNDDTLKTLYSFTYSVMAPQKPDPSYQEVEVTKYREVTKFGEVTKEVYTPVELTVLKTHTVTAYKRVSLLDYLLHY
jgi:uncharacterized protein YxeA